MTASGHINARAPGAIIQVGLIVLGLLANVAAAQVRGGLRDGRANADGPGPVEVRRLLPDEGAVRSVEVRSEVRRSAERLGSPEYTIREAAMDELLTGTARLEELCALLAEDDVSPEQRTRLLVVVQERLRDAPRGAVGIRMLFRQEAIGQPGAVEITDLLPGLPAEQVLEVGDLIVTIDGVPLNHRNDLVVLVQSKRPGDAVKLKVNREQRDERGDLIIGDNGRVVYKAMDLTLRLGSAEQLDAQPRSAPSPVDERRKREVDEAGWRYGSEPMFVPIAGGHDSGLIVAGIDTPTTAVEVATARVVDSLEMEMELIKKGQLERTPQREARWADDFERLERAAEAPDLSERERLFVQKMLLKFRGTLARRP